MLEMTIGSTNTARSATLARILAVRPTASRNARTLTSRTVTSANPIVNRYELRIAGSEKSAT